MRARSRSRSTMLAGHLNADCNEPRISAGLGLGLGRCSAGICIMAATHCSGNGNPKSAHLQLSMSRAYDYLSSLCVQPWSPSVLPNQTLPFHSSPFHLLSVVSKRKHLALLSIGLCHHVAPFQMNMN